MSKARELAELGAVYDSGALSNRNMIINGNMQFAQRGTTSSISTSANTYLLDRFFTRIQGSSGAATASRETDAPNGLSKSLKFTVDTADSTLDSGHYNRIHQEIEGHNGAALKWGTADAEPASLSFWVKSSVTGTYSIGIYNGNADRSYVSEYTISAANTWEYKTIYIAPITTGSWVIDSSAEFRISWSLGAGSTFSTGTVDQWQSAFNFSSSNNVNLMATSSATFFLTGVQFEVGPEATPFEHRSFGDELARCLRYYEQWDTVDGENIAIGTSYSGINPHCVLNMKVIKRAAPTVTLPAAGSANGQIAFLTGQGNTPSTIGTHSTDKLNTRSIRIGSSGYSGLSTSEPSALYAYGGASSIKFDAEL